MGPPTNKLKLSAASSRSPSGAVPPAWQTEQIGVKIFSWIDWRSAESGGGGLPPGTSGRPLASKPSPLPAHAAANNAQSATEVRRGRERCDCREFIVKSPKPSQRDIHDPDAKNAAANPARQTAHRGRKAFQNWVSEVAGVAWICEVSAQAIVKGLICAAGIDEDWGCSA